jgi:predicted Na+-dependent transporter
VWDNETFHCRINHFGSCCGLFLILISIFLSSGADGADVNIWSLPWAFYVGTAFPCVVGMLLANIGARMLGLTKPECVAISIEVRTHDYIPSPHEKPPSGYLFFFSFSLAIII